MRHCAGIAAAFAAGARTHAGRRPPSPRSRPVIPGAWLLSLLLSLAAACAAPTMEARIAHGEERSGEAEAALDEAEKAMAALEPTVAEERLSEATEALGDPDAALYPEHELLQGRLSAARTKLGVVRAEKARRDLELEVERRRDLLVQALEKLRLLQEALGAASVAARDVEAAKDAAEELEEALADGKELEPRDPDYAAYASGARRKHEEALKALERAGRVVAFVAGPLTRLQEATALRKKAEAARAEERTELQQEALAGLKECLDEGTRALAVAPPIGTAGVLLDGTATTPAAVTERCRKDAEALAAAILKAEKEARKAAARKPPAKEVKKEAKKPRSGSKLKPEPAAKQPAPKKGAKPVFIR